MQAISCQWASGSRVVLFSNTDVARETGLGGGRGGKMHPAVFEP